MPNVYGSSLVPVEQVQGNKYGTSLVPIEPVEEATVEEYKMEPGGKSLLGLEETELARSVAAGLYKASGSMAELISAGGEVVYDTGRIIGREAYKAATDTPESEMELWEETDYFSRGFRETTERDVKAMMGEDPHAIAKYSEKIAEYAGVTQAVARNMLAKGKALNEVPTAIRRGLRGNLEKVMMQAAKDPAKAVKLEQGVSALVAASGETIKNLGGSPTTQLIGEVVTGLLSGQIINTSKSIAAYVAKKAPYLANNASKIQAAEYIQEVAKNDPRFMQKFEEGLKLQKETGIKMNLAELSNNPELKAALQLMDFRSAGTATAIEARLARITKDIKKMFPSDPKLIRAVDDVLDSIDAAAPLDKQQLGETGRAALSASREAANSEVNRLYNEVGSPNIQTNLIRKSLIDARQSPLKNDNYMNELDAELVSVLEANILGKTGEAGKRVIEAPVKKITLHGAPSKIISLDGVRLIESKLKERIRIASAAGELNKKRLLSKILDGVYRQYDVTTGLPRHEIANLKKASAASKRVHEIYDQGEVLLQSRVNVKGMERVTTEGFVRNFIRPNSESNFARTEEAVDGFYNAYGDMPEARQWMINSFGALLKEEIGRQGDKIRPAQIKRFINKHSRFLKRARISGEFDNIVKAVENANLADSAKVLDFKEFQKTVMSKFVGSNDTVNFVMNAATSGSLKKLVAEVNRIPNKSKRNLIQSGIKEALWEGAKRKMTTSKHVQDEILFDTSTVRNMLDDINYGQELRAGLGETHYNSLKKMLSVVDRISPDITTSAGLPKEHIDEQLVEKLMTGLRAAAHGFVRPDLIAAQMSMRGYKAITTKQAHNILRHAMTNENFAKELLKMSTAVNGEKIVKTMFSPLAATAILEKTAIEEESQ